MKKLFLILFLLISKGSFCQSINGVISDASGEKIPFANVYLKNTKIGISSDNTGFYELKNIPKGNHTLVVSVVGFQSKSIKISIKNDEKITQNFVLDETDSLDEIVVSGTLKPVSKLESPVPVEIYNNTFFKKNPTPSVFESLQNVNGIRPQLNCNVCNTGDIHINGLEGPYTFVLIDGMPIVSGLSTVYGLTGIPQALIERV
ncbi:MAG: TonB-dependent receptor, partial [Polaribacter sp.]|nr:TonB-dependent receptor [Polaribacter sp.]